MPRKNSTSWSVGNPVTATRQNAINSDLDDLYALGSDRLKVYRLTGDPALQITIGAGNFRVGSTEWQYAGGTVTVGSTATTYIMIDSSGTIQTSTSAWNAQYARLAIVTSSAGAITTINIWKIDAPGGDSGGNPTGTMLIWPTASAPTGYLLCDGTAVSRSTYSVLFALISTTYGVGDGSTTFNLPNLSWRFPVGSQAATSIGTATITIATPGVVTFTNHGLSDGNKVYFTTTGALPTGLTASTEYFIRDATANTFSLATTFGGAAITTSGTQSGTHTLFSANFNAMWETGGEVSHKLSVWELAAHDHWFPDMASNTWANTTLVSHGNISNNNVSRTSNTWWDAAHNNLPPYLTVNFIIKT